MGFRFWVSEMITIPFFWQDSEFATGYGYPKTTFKREPDTDPDIRNGFSNASMIQTFGKSCTFIHSLSSEAFFQPSVP